MCYEMPFSEGSADLQGRTVGFLTDLGELCRKYTVSLTNGSFSIATLDKGRNFEERDGLLEEVFFSELRAKCGRAECRTDADEKLCLSTPKQ